MKGKEIEALFYTVTKSKVFHRPSKLAMDRLPWKTSVGI